MPDLGHDLQSDGASTSSGPDSGEASQAPPQRERVPPAALPLQFGSFVTPSAADPHRVVALAQLAEQAGLDLVSYQDHPYQGQHLDMWTLLSVVAAQTSRITVAPNVANVPLRSPLVLARAAATLDLLTGGRVELGVGAGGFWDAIEAAGGERRTPGEAVRALAEAIAVVRASWDTSRRSIRVEGQFHRISGVHPGPAPAHPIGIWVGAYGPKMLALTGRLADGWLPSSGYLAPEGLAGANARIDEAAVAAGRSPSDVRRLYNVSGSFGGRGTAFLQGPPEVWAEQLAGLAIDEGMSTFVLASDDPDDIRRFAAEVAPAVRELVEAERAGPSSPVRVHQAGLVNPSTPAPAVTPGLDVVPTPDDGERRSAERPWDDATRPTGPVPDPGRAYTAHEQAAGQHLVDVHDHLRAELRQVLDLVDQVEAGHLAVGDARSVLNEMTLRQNNWTLGTYCESYCRVVATHHIIEDQSMFPYLRTAEPALAPVVDRLAEEHHVIHDVLERVDRALVALVSGGDTAELRSAVDLLHDTLLSHLSYEERELVEPLARLGFG